MPIGPPLLNGPTEFGAWHPIPTQFTKSPKKWADDGDLLFCVRGSTTGRMNWADQRYAIGRGIAAIRHRSDKGLNSLVRGVIEWQLPDLLTAATGSTFPNISGPQLANLPWPQAVIGSERAIANVLSSLDHKIELNRRINITLERMAQALFHDWFVDFGPVRRKQAAATEPHTILGDLIHNAEMASRIASHFPDNFGINGLPQNWERKFLGELIDVKRGGSPRPIKDYITSEGLPWVKIADATSLSGPNLFETKEFIRLSGLRKTVKLAAGDLILSNSATPGLPKFLQLEACIHDGWLYFPKIDYFTKAHLYLQFLEAKKLIVGRATGSVFANLKTDTIKSFSVVVAPKPIAEAFQFLIEPIFETILHKEREIRTLAETREYLLPRLLSGKVQIADVETMVA